MVYCEKCGSLNDGESFFCSSCGMDLPRSKSEPIVFGKSTEEVSASPSKKFIEKSPVKPPMKRARPTMPRVQPMKPFFFGKRSSTRPSKDSPKSEKTQAVLSLIFGLTIITISLAIAIPGSDSTTIIFGIGFTLIALLFLYYRSLLSSRDPVFYIAVASAVISLGLALMIGSPSDSDSPPIIFGIGFIVTTLIYIYYRYRISDRDPVFFLAVGVAVLSLGLQLTIQTDEPVILGIGFGLTALVYIYYRSRISDRDPIFFIISAILVITIGFALAIGDDSSLIFGVGFGFVGVALILNGFLRPFLQSNLIT